MVRNQNFREINSLQVYVYTLVDTSLKFYLFSWSADF